MRRLIVIGGIFLCIIAHRAEAHLEFDSTDIKLSPRIDDSTATADISFKNTGNHAILIKGITTSCSCTTASSDKKIYLPGESGKISATVEIGGNHGEMTKNVTIETDDANQPTTKLTIHLAIPSLAILSPQTIQWTSGSDNNEQIVNVKISGVMPVKITGLKPWSDKISAKLTVIQEGKEYRVAVRPASTKDSLVEVVELLTDIKDPDIRKRIWLFVRINKASSTQPLTSVAR